MVEQAWREYTEAWSGRKRYFDNVVRGCAASGGLASCVEGR